jgi:hypothetical protein
VPSVPCLFNDVESMHSDLVCHNQSTGCSGCGLQAGISSLVWVEHSNGKPSAATLNTITAAKGLGGDVTALVAGAGVKPAADKVAGISGVTKVRAVQPVPCQQCALSAQQ